MTQGELLGANLFAYAGNNPVMYVDPSGYKAVSILAIVLDIAILVFAFTPFGVWIKTAILTAIAIRIGIAVYQLYEANKILKRNPRDADANYQKYFSYLTIAAGVLGVICTLAGWNVNRLNSSVIRTTLDAVGKVWGTAFGGGIVMSDIIQFMSSKQKPKRRSSY